MRGKYDIKERGMKSVGCYKENIATVSSCRNVTKIQEETEHKKKYSFFLYVQYRLNFWFDFHIK